MEKEAENLNPSNPYQPNVSEKKFSGAWIPAKNAKMIKAGIESNSAPFLPGTDGQIKAEPIYSVHTGSCLLGTQLIPAQLARQSAGYASNVVATYNGVQNMGTVIRKGEHGVFYNFKGKDEKIHTASLFFAEQTEHPEKFASPAQGKIKDGLSLAGTTIDITSSVPEEYLGAYIAACRTGAGLKVEPKIADEFKQKLLQVCDNHLASRFVKRDDRTAENPGIMSVLYGASKKSFEIINEKEKELGKSLEQKPVQKEKQLKKEQSVER